MSAGRLPEGLQRWRETLHAVDRSPGEEWRGRLVHHGFRGALVLGMALLVPFLFPQHTLPQFENLREGMRVPRDIVAEVTFTVYKTEEQLDAERREAEQGVTPIFSFRPSAADSAAARVTVLFARLDSATAAAQGEDADVSDTTAIRRVLERHGVPHSPEQVAFLSDQGRRQLLRRTLESAFLTELAAGVASGAELDAVGSPLIRVKGADEERLVPRDSVSRVRDFLVAASRRAQGRLSGPGRELYQNILVRYVEPTLSLDRAATRQAREWARSAVEAAAGYVLDGATIVAAGQRLDREEMEKLRAYADKLEAEGLIGGLAGFLRGLGSTLFAALLLGLLGGTLLLYRPDAYRDIRSFGLIFLLVLVVLVLAGVIGSREGPPALIPIALAALLIGALYDGLLALAAVFTVALLLGGLPPFTGFAVPFTTVAAGSAAALAIREVRRRSQSWILIAVITGGYVIAAVALLLMGFVAFRDVLGTVAWGAVNATACTALAVAAALPALEKFTGRTTDQTLLELADLNQPLLRRLSREAPGTYAHSISLANLAEAACQAIGANALLARVGVYYHDIGKMLRPQFFIENQPKGMNPHDRLPPEKSAEVIREHVREGLRLADEAGLPSVIKDFIREHHGTQKIAYFWARAKERAPDADLDPSDFCYPGPKPQSKETAVVLLADAVESTARTLAEPTPDRIRELVDRIVDARVEEGELDQSPLTLRELDVVKGEFVRVLTGVYHHRIDYPTTEPPADLRERRRRRRGDREPAAPAEGGEETPSAAGGGSPTG